MPAQQALVCVSRGKLQPCCGTLMRCFITLVIPRPPHRSTFCAFPPINKTLSNVTLPISFFGNNRYIEYGFPNYQGSTPELYAFLGHVLPPYTPSESTPLLKVPRASTGPSPSALHLL